MKGPEFTMNGQKTDMIRADHTAFQTFLLHGIAVCVPNEALALIKDMAEENRIDIDPVQYAMRANDLVADLAMMPLEGGARQAAFDTMSPEAKARLLPNIAALLIVGVRSWPDHAVGEGAAS